MRHSATLLALLTISLPVLSQEIQRSSNPQGVQIQGNANLRAQQESAVAVTVGEVNVSRNTAGAVKGDTQIQGNTKVKAEQKNVTATAVGRNNAAGNEVGVIGGK